MFFSKSSTRVLASNWKISIEYSSISKSSIMETLRPAFCKKKFRMQLLLYLIFLFVLFWRKNIGAMSAYEMLVKLTPVYNEYNIFCVPISTVRVQRNHCSNDQLSTTATMPGSSGNCCTEVWLDIYKNIYPLIKLLCVNMKLTLSKSWPCYRISVLKCSLKKF